MTDVTTDRDATQPAAGAAGDSPVSPDGSGGRIGEVARRRSQLKAAMTALGGALAELAPDAATAVLDDVRAATAGVQAALAHHVEVHEGPESFHSEVLHSQPHLASRITWLQRDHERLSSGVAAFTELLSEADAQVAAVKAQGERLLHDLARHRRRGADLVWDAFEFDIGGGD